MRELLVEGYQITGIHLRRDKTEVQIHHFSVPQGKGVVENPPLEGLRFASILGGGEKNVDICHRHWCANFL